MIYISHWRCEAHIESFFSAGNFGVARIMFFLEIPGKAKTIHLDTSTSCFCVDSYLSIGNKFYKLQTCLKHEHFMYVLC